MNLVIRHVIGQNEGLVVGCKSCGTVETLYGTAEHNCKGETSFFALHTNEPANGVRQAVNAVRI